MFKCQEERFNQTFVNMLASESAVISLDRWSEFREETLVKYNSTKHSTTKFAPAVALYSWICNGIDEVPKAYRVLLQQALETFDSWNSMKLHVKSQIKVLFHLLSQ